MEFVENYFTILKLVYLFTQDLNLKTTSSYRKIN